MTRPTPNAPAEYSEKEQRAIDAWANGTADEEQQKLAYAWVVHTVSQCEGMSFYPGGPEGDRSTSFFEGRRFVGNQIRKMSHPLTIASLKNQRDKAAKQANKPRRGTQ